MSLYIKDEKMETSQEENRESLTEGEDVGIMNDNVDLGIDIDRCHSKLHNDFAILISKMLKKNYKYIGHNEWIFTIENNIWKKDIKQQHLINEIKTTIFDKIQERVSFWDKKKELVKFVDENIYQDYAKFSTNLQLASLRLKDIRFLKALIKELKPFLYDEHHDVNSDAVRNANNTVR
jgi:hypothetical protein